VTGGVRSGKSRYAESLIAADLPAAYLTPGYPADPKADLEWAERVANHQRLRSSLWETVETLELAEALRQTTKPVLIDCLGIWVTRTIDQLEGWERPTAQWQPALEEKVSQLAAAVREHSNDVVLVTNEIGWGVVPPYQAGRIFADELGRTNQRIAAVCDRVVLLVAGRVLELPIPIARA
jgi:adenosylcobinamide kinase/adenosylcobinamide-phosphate guanylyltransferase